MDLDAALGAWIDGEASAQQREALLDAVRSDPERLRLLDETYALHRLLDAVFAPPDEGLAAAAVLAELRAERGGFARGVMDALRHEVPARTASRRWPRVLAAAAVLLVVIGLAWLAATRLPRGDDGSRTPLARIASAGAQTHIVRDGERLPVDDRGPVFPGDVIVTGEYPAVLYDGEDHAYLFGGSRLRVDVTGWRLERGALRLTTALERPVATEHVTVRIGAGTTLVEHSVLGTLVRVDRGDSAVEDPGRDGILVVGAGSSEMFLADPAYLDAGIYVTEK